MALAHRALTRQPALGAAAPPTLEPVTTAPSPTGVVVLHWPSEEHIRTRLQAYGIPRLLVVDSDDALPIAADPIEDWMFDRGDDGELDRRVAALERAAARRAGPPPPPVIDEHDLLRYAGRWVALPPGEARLMRVLLARMGTCAPLAELEPSAARRSSLRGRLRRLRARIGPLGFTITTVRNRGVVLTHT